MADVFISYSSKDESIVTPICERLRSAGITCWVAYENEQFGDSYAKTITENLLASKVVLLCMSPASGVSPHVERELDIAVNQNKKILPILLTDFDLTDTCFAYYAGSTHYMRYKKGEDFLDRLEMRVRNLLHPLDLPDPPPPKPRKWLPLLIGAAAVLLIGLAVGLFLLLGNRGAQDDPSGSAPSAESPVGAISSEESTPDEESKPDEEPVEMSTFSGGGMEITLPADFYADAEEGYDAFYASKDLCVYVTKFPFDQYEGMSDLPIEAFADYAMVHAGHKNAALQTRDGMTYYTFAYPTSDNGITAHATVYLYRSYNAYWSVEFMFADAHFDKYASSILQWAKSVTFTETFTFKDMEIDLPVGSLEYPNQNENIFSYRSDSVFVKILKYPFDPSGSIAKLTLEEFAESSLKTVKTEHSGLLTKDGLIFYTYTKDPNSQGVVRQCAEYVYRSSDGFWLVEFDAYESEWKQTEPFFHEWAKSVRFADRSAGS